MDRAILTIDYAAHAGFRHRVACRDNRLVRLFKYVVTAIVLVPFIAGGLGLFLLLLDVPFAM